MSEIIQGKKKVFTNKEINIFRAEDNTITVQNVFDQIKENQLVLSYLPNEPEEYANHKLYLFSIVNTIDITFFGRLAVERAKAKERLNVEKLPPKK